MTCSRSCGPREEEETRRRGEESFSWFEERVVRRRRRRRRRAARVGAGVRLTGARRRRVAVMLRIRRTRSSTIILILVAALPSQELERPRPNVDLGLAPRTPPLALRDLPNPDRAVPHCLACWHGHSTCRSTPARASKRCRQIPQSRWSPDMTRTGNGKSPPSPTATADSARRRSTSASPSPRTSPSVSSSFGSSGSFGFVRSVEGGRALSAGEKADGRFRRVRSFARRSRASRRPRAAEEGLVSSRSSDRFVFDRKNPPSGPTLLLSAPKTRASHVASRTSRGGTTAPRRCSRARRERRAFAKALGEGAGGDERRRQFVGGRVADVRGIARSSPPARARVARARVLRAGARTLGASLQAHLHVLLQQHLVPSFAHTGHRWNRERWFGGEHAVPRRTRRPRTAYVARTRGVRSCPRNRERGPLLPRGSSSSRRSSSWLFQTQSGVPKPAASRARHDHAKRKGPRFYLFPPSTRDDVALRTPRDALSLSHVRSLHLDVGARLEPVAAPRPRVWRERARARRESRARRVPIPGR